MPKITFNSWDGGLILLGGKEQIPRTSLRRNMGIYGWTNVSIRSRLGSTLLYSGLNADSLYWFNTVRYQGVAGKLYKNGVLLHTSPGTGRVQFVRMPPQISLYDYLFVAGGGDPYKTDVNGAVTNWGIAAVGSQPTLAAGAAGVLTGTYLGTVVFKNGVTGSRSNPAPSPYATVTVTAQQITWSNIPVSTDPQVTQRELYRTSADGATLSLLTTINDNVTTTFTDNLPDSQLNVAAFTLQLDNIPPPSDLKYVDGPLNGVIWGCGASGIAAGRVYYSGPGRPESFIGFLELTNPDNPTTGVKVWNGSVWVWTMNALWQIVGTNPYLSRTVFGAPGTNNPYSIQPTPFGIVYESHPGLYLFDGNSATPIGVNEVGPIWRGIPAENIPAMDVLVTGYGREKLYVSNGQRCLSVNMRTGNWRDQGPLNANAFFWEDHNQTLVATINGNVVKFEDTGNAGYPPTLPATVPPSTDAGAGIPFEVETAATLLDPVQMGNLLRVFVDANTNGQFLTPVIVYGDDSTSSLPAFQTASRALTEWTVSLTAAQRSISLRLTGSLTQPVEIFEIAFDPYQPIPTEEITPSYKNVQGQTIGSVPPGA